MSLDKDTIAQYLNDTQFIILTTVNEKNEPVTRTLGSFAADDTTLYFSTHGASEKTVHIEKNPSVGVLFQHENQKISEFKNVFILGTAKEITEEKDLKKAVSFIGDRNPRFRERAESGQLAANKFYQIQPREIKLLDFSKGPGPAAVEVIKPVYV